jgi:glycosyltransferase involved in cell wall biosynthesis
MTAQVELSVVITCYDPQRKESILKLIDSIKNQDGCLVEAVIVVGKSKDLYDSLNQYVPKDFVVVLNKGDTGLSAQRNLALPSARGQVIAFVDDDVFLPQHWARHVLSTFRDPVVVGVTGPVYSETSEVFLRVPRGLSWVISCSDCFGLEKIEYVRHAWGGNMAFRRAAIKDEAFQTHLGLGASGIVQSLLPIEDVEFCARIVRKTGGKIAFNPKCLVYHRVEKYRTDSRYLTRRAFSMGYSRPYVAMYFSESPVPLRRELTHLVGLPRDLTRDIVHAALVHPLSALRLQVVSLLILVSTALGFLIGTMHKTFSGKP